MAIIRAINADGQPVCHTVMIDRVDEVVAELKKDHYQITVFTG